MALSTIGRKYLESRRAAASLSTTKTPAVTGGKTELTGYKRGYPMGAQKVSAVDADASILRILDGL